ncbi:MAG: hypothetical protein N2319_02390 [Candidatus Kapabacteria bacterium]|nr:hypothetical protein [Candidatus Kapabacteria bacterium]
MKTNIVIFYIFFALVVSLNAQISIYPPSLFIDNRTRSGELTIKNTSNELREIAMEAIFGYIGYDSLGNRMDIYNDTTNLINYSLARFLKIFPPKLIVPPNELQTVRVFLLNLPDLPDGTYITRFSAISNPLSKQIDTTNQGQVSASISLRTKMISAIFYQKGNLTTDISFELEKIISDSNNYSLLFNVSKFGNSPFWGKLKYQIFDEKGKEVVGADELISYYIQSKKRITIDRNLIKSGRYKIELFYSTDRSDIPEERRIPFKDKKQEIYFNID